MSFTKICTKCKKEKIYSDFNKQKKSPDGYKYICRECSKKADSLRIYNKEYRINDKEKIKERSKKYHEKNREIIKVKRRKNYLLHKNERIQYDNNYKKSRKYTDAEFRLKLTICSLFRNQLNINNGTKKSKSFIAYTGVEKNDYIKHLKKDLLWTSYLNREKIHIDHIIPISAYDFNIPQDIKNCWNPKNLRLLKASDNILKSNKIDIDLINKFNIRHLLPEKESHYASVKILSK